MPDVVAPRLAGVRRRLGALAPASLLARVRWLFLVFWAMVGITTLAGVTQIPDQPVENRAAATALLVVLLVWAFYRYRHPDLHPVSDVVPLVGVFLLGRSLGSVAYSFGPAFVLLYFRSMYGSTREALINGVLYFAAYHGAAVANGEATLLSLVAVLFFVTFTTIAWVMQSLGSVADRHERLAERERVLTATSADLLAARTPHAVLEAAAAGLLRLGSEGGGGLVTAWRLEGTTTLRLMARAGDNEPTLDRVDLRGVGQHRLARLLGGRPYILPEDEVRAIEALLGLPPDYREFLVAPMVSEGTTRLVLALSSSRPLEPRVIDLVERFANEVSLALDRTRLLAELEEANAELRRADDVKNQFISTVSHELRTPLTSIRGFAETLRSRWDELSPEARNHYLAVIDRQGARQQRLVDDLLTTSTMLSGRLRIEAADMALAPVLEAALEEVGIDRSDLVLPGSPDVHVHADPHHVQQILANLLSNARKYGIPPFGIDVHADDDVTIRVWDSGAGVDAAFRPHLFDPFRQADGSDRRAGAGVGLGLAIVHSLVTANGGTVRYVDERSKGAVFALTLPRRSTR